MPSLSKPGIVNPIQQTTGVLVKKIRVDYVSLHIARLPLGSFHCRAAEYNKLFRFRPRGKKPVRKYSQGMKQKLGIIQAIMENQNLLVLDEPFNALDEKSVKLFRELLIEYKKQEKLIILTSLIIRKTLNLYATTPIEYSQGRLLQNNVKQTPTQDGATDDGCCTLHFCFRYCQYPRL